MENAVAKVSLPRFRLTKKAVQAAIDGHIKGARDRIWDADLKEFYLQITPAGSASYCLRYTRLDGSKGDFTIGSAQLLSPEQARTIGRDRLAELIANRVDPVTDRRQARMDAKKRRSDTFGKLVELFNENKEHLRHTTKMGRKSALERYLLPKFAHRPVAEITSLEIRSALESFRRDMSLRHGARKKFRGGNRTANYCHQTMKAIFSWGISNGLCTVNPAQFNTIFDEKPVKRKDALTDERLRIIWTRLDELEVEGKFPATIWGIKLAILTLQRPNEVAQAHRSDIDLSEDLWRPHADRTKTGEEYYVPLSSEAASLFGKLLDRSDSVWALPHRDKVLEHSDIGTCSQRFVKIREDLFERGLLDSNDIDLYDFRRYGRTIIRARLKFSKDVAEAVISHKQLDDISTLYDLSDYQDDVRIAQLAWTTEVLRIVYGTDGRTPPADQHIGGEASSRL